MADALSRLLRLRAAEADAARRDLATALRTQDDAAATLEQAGDALETERRGAARDPSHPLAGSYAAWLPAGRAALGRAQADNEAAKDALDVARLALAEARLAAEACEKLAEARRAMRVAKLDRAAQIALEDLPKRAAS